jgi:hypothetical protein
MLIQAQDLVIFGHLNMEFASYFDFGELQSLSFDEAKNNHRYLFELMVDALMLHIYWIFCIYKLLLSEELGI